MGRRNDPSGQPRTLLMRGIEALSRREYARQELGRKLMRGLAEGETAGDVQAVLDTLEQKGYLSNGRYAAARVRTRSGRFGNRRLAQELAAAGVAGEDIRTALAEAPDEYERARTVWSKKYSSAPADRRERDRQVRFLAARGFGFDIISRLLREQACAADDLDMP